MWWTGRRTDHRHKFKFEKWATTKTSTSDTHIIVDPLFVPFHSTVHAGHMLMPMVVTTPARRLRVHATQRFGVLGCGGEAQPCVAAAAAVYHDDDHDDMGRAQAFVPKNQKDEQEHVERFVLPIMALEDLLLRRHATTTTTTTTAVQSQLKKALVQHGFVLLTVQHAKAVAVIRGMRESLQTDLFPTTTTLTMTTTNAHDDAELRRNNNAGNLPTSSVLYVSEKGVPMFKLGYELCDDGVREVFRVAAGSPCSVEVWPTTTATETTTTTTTTTTTVVATTNETVQSKWMRGLGLMRHVTDAALDLLLLDQHQQQQQQGEHLNPPPGRQRRPHSGSAAWLHAADSQQQQQKQQQNERPGDLSILYAMHYFNSSDSELAEVEPGVAVKAHVDPSLLVVEPFLCPTTRGLQVWNRQTETWMDCDGPDSPVITLLRSFQTTEAAAAATTTTTEVMLLFCGKALTAAIPAIEPTRHRVVTGDLPRRTVIYEQKYAEFYPPPSFD